MAVELIAKIQQKNNGAFYLVDAEDVEIAPITGLTSTDVQGALEELKALLTVNGELYVQATNPGMTDPGLWVEIDTTLDVVDTFWVETGV